MVLCWLLLPRAEASIHGDLVLTALRAGGTAVGWWVAEALDGVALEVGGTLECRSSAAAEFHRQEHCLQASA